MYVETHTTPAVIYNANGIADIYRKPTFGIG